MFRYFGFGSNMNMTSLRAKGVIPLAARRAALYGWRLRFNVQHFFRHEGGVCNIEPSSNPTDRVLGILYDCPEEALAPLDAAEAYGHGYDRITIELETEGEAEPVSATTFIGMPEFIDNQCLPSRRYLNIVVEGARSAGLDSSYIEDLATQPVHQPAAYPTFCPPPGDYPIFNATDLAKYPLYTSLWGSVFDMTEARSLHTFLKGFFGGQDMTLFHLKRLDSSTSNESMEDIRQGRLNKAQRDYLNAYLNEYAREYRYAGQFSYDEN